MEKGQKIIDLEKRIKMNATLKKEPKTLDCVIKMRTLAQKAMKERGLTEREIRKAVEFERYEK